MASQHRVFYLTYGQMSPDGSTGIVLDDGAIMWSGTVGTFPDNAELGTHLATDPTFDTTYTHSLATQDELDEYLAILATISG